jgi:hypothetical protein
MSMLHWKTSLENGCGKSLEVITAVIVGVFDVSLIGSCAYFSSSVHGGMTYKVEYTDVKVIYNVLEAD